MLKFFFSLLLYFLLIGFASAQTDTSHFKSPDSTSFYQFFSSYDTVKSKSPLLFFTDTISFWIYNVLPLYRNANFNGNIASFRILHRQDDFISDSVFCLVPFFSNLLLKKNSFTSTISSHPATVAIYTWGLKKEQTFQIYYTQRISSQLALNLFYNLLNAPGIYQRQKTNQHHFWSQLNWLNKKKNKFISTGIVTGKILQNENGGIKYLKDFEDTTIYSREFVQINLLTAERRIRQSKYYLDQYYKIISNNSNFNLIISFQSFLSSTKHVFEDLHPDTTYYNVIFNNTLTYDSVYHQSFGQSLIFSNVFPFEYNKKNKMFNWLCGITYHHDNILQKAIEYKFNWFDFVSRFTGILPFAIALELHAKYSIGEYLNNNKSFGVLLKKDLIKVKHSAGISYDYKKFSPYWIYSHTSTNHSYWNNIFPLQEQHKLILFVRMKSVSFEARTYLLRNFVFVNTIGVPDIFDKQLFVYTFRFKIHLEKKYIFTVMNFDYQKSSFDNVLRFPELYTDIRVGFSWQMFRGALRCFMGVEMFWFSAFYAQRWLVPEGLFANQDSIQIGEYLYPSIFLGLNLKRVRFFAHLDNVASGIYPIKYYAMPYYPRFDRFFRWGISWTFFN